MALFPAGKPNVKALARRGDVDGLVAAAGFQDLVEAPDGGLLDRGAEIRREAILALGALGPQHGTEAVQAAIGDASDAVRVAAIRVLHARRDAMALAAGLAWLPRQGQARDVAIAAVGELCRAETAPVVASALARAPHDALIDDRAAELLTLLLDADEGSDVHSDVVEELRLALANEQDAVAERARELLVLIAPVSTEAVIAELQAGVAPHRAAGVLAQINDPRALEPLLEGLRHWDPRVRAECVRALGKLGDPAAVEALVQATRDPDNLVAAQANSALDRFGTVALVVRISTMILDVLAGTESRPVLQGMPQRSAGEPTPGSAPTGPQMLERLLADTDKSTPSHPSWS